MDEILNKLNQLTEEEKNQLSDKQKKALKALIGSKPSVPFSSATLDHCIRKDGLNLNIDYVSIDAPSLHIPAAIPTPVASDFLCETLHRIKSVWVLDNEKACRIFIDAILTEVLLSEANKDLGFCGVKKGRDSVTLVMWIIFLGLQKPNQWITWTPFFW